MMSAITVLSTFTISTHATPAMHYSTFRRKSAKSGCHIMQTQIIIVKLETMINHNIPQQRSIVVNNDWWNLCEVVDSLCWHPCLGKANVIFI